jgi:ketosteroid isomerase-like protein
VHRIIFALSLLLGLGVVSRAGSAKEAIESDAARAWPPDLASLVAAERDFARLGVERGTREAFLTYLAPDALLFRPRPEPGRAHWEKRPEPNAIRSWEPAFASTSRAGDLGYTTGPWVLTRRGEAKAPPAHGQFVSIWRREAGGDWRVVIDLGIVHARPDSGGVRLAVHVPVVAEGDSVADHAALAKELEAADRALSGAVARGGAAAFDSAAADDIRLLRMGFPPFVGREAVRKALAAKPGPLPWEPDTAVVSRSGDLGYSYGTAGFHPGDAGGGGAAARGASTEMSYVRVWRREPGGWWRVALDIALGVPAARDGS